MATKKYYFLSEEQISELKKAYRNANDKNDKTFNLLVDVSQTQKITKENIKNIEKNL